MKDRYFLWPSGRAMNGIKHTLKFTNPSLIEAKLRQMFPSGYPVLCSSGRSALFLALQASKVSRAELVGTFPYASHCVLDTISRVATPLSGETWVKADLRVVYHQWGFVQETNLPSNSIEDCVDTLCIPGTNLFTAGGNFEIWSLPKILGTTSGGVLWCKSEDDASQIKQIRNKRGRALLQWILRLISRNNAAVYKYWQGAESELGNVSKLQTGEIMNAIGKWDEAVSNRLRKMEKIWKYSESWVRKTEGRLPPVVPVETTMSQEEAVRHGIESGCRSIERISENNIREIIKTLPVPIHQDVDDRWLDLFIKQLVQDER